MNGRPIPRDRQVKVALAITIGFGVLGMFFSVATGDIGTALAWLVATLAAGFYFYGHWALVETIKRQRAMIEDLAELLTAVTNGTVVITDQRTGYTCPRCGKTSHHPKDAEFRYCANCHAFESEAAPGHH